MIWFLRLIRAYRDLEAELALAADARIRAEDDSRLWRALCERAEQSRDGINTEYTRLLRRMANLDASEAQADPDVPATGNLTPPPYRRSLREIQQDAVMKSRTDAANRRMALVNGDQED